VNQRKRSKSASGKRKIAGLDEVPPPPDLRRSRERPGTPAPTNSMIVFCGDAQQVSEGFALALSAMEANAEALMMGTEPPSKEK
jgi:hypothetical protein